jgi:hypothetical protein
LFNWVSLTPANQSFSEAMNVAVYTDKSA